MRRYLALLGAAIFSITSVVAQTVITPYTDGQCNKPVQGYSWDNQLNANFTIDRGWPDVEGYSVRSQATYAGYMLTNRRIRNSRAQKHHPTLGVTPFIGVYHSQTPPAELSLCLSIHSSSTAHWDFRRHMAMCKEKDLRPHR